MTLVSGQRWHHCWESYLIHQQIWQLYLQNTSQIQPFPHGIHHPFSRWLRSPLWIIPVFPKQSSCFHPFFPESVLHPVCVACSLGTRGLAVTFLINSESSVGLCDPASSSLLTLSPTKDPQWLHCSLHLLAPGLFPPCRMPLPRFLRLDSFHLSSLVTLRGRLGGSIISFYFFKFSLPYTMLSV